MKVDQINTGDLIRHEGKVCRVMEKELRGHGKVAPTIHVKFKEIESGSFLEQTFRPGDVLDKVEAETVQMEYSYAEESFYVFMDLNTFEQVRFNKKMMGKKAAFLQEGSSIRVMMIDGEAMSVEFPETITLKVTMAMDGLKNVDKEVELENGLKMLVPHFVNENDSIVVRTEDCSYVERVTLKTLQK
jgi:elongation factor P